MVARVTLLRCVVRLVDWWPGRARDETAVVRHQATGSYVAAGHQPVSDIRAAVGFESAEQARRYVEAHCCEPAAFEVTPRSRTSAAAA